MNFDWLNSLKNYLTDRPETAFLSLSLGVNVYLFRAYVKAKDDQLALVLQWMPVAERMTRVFETVAKKARGRRPSALAEKGE